METGVTLSNNKSGTDIYRPRVDETPVPCESYHSTDCIYVSDNLDASYIGIGSMENLSTLLHKMIQEIKFRDREIARLDNEIKKLKKWQ